MRPTRQLPGSRDRKDSPDRTVIPVAPAQPRAETGSAPLVADLNSPEFMQRVASGDPAALQALSKLSAQSRGWAGSGSVSPPSVPQGVTNSQMQTAIQRNAAAGNPAMAAALGNSLAMSTNPGAGGTIARADEEQRRNAPTFPLLVQEAEVAVHWLTETGRHDVTSVTINSGQAGGAINVVDANGKYASRVVSLDSLPGLNTNPTGVPTPSNVGGQAAYTNVMSNGPTNSVTLAPNARVPEGYQKDPITGEVTKSDLPANPDQKPRK